MTQTARQTTRQAAFAAAAVQAIALMLGCGGSGTRSAAPTTDFECKDRRVAYIVTNSFAGPEVGVVIDCAKRGPRLEKWRVLDEGGDRQASDFSLTPGEFEDVWERVEATGWRNLGDCDNPDASEGDPEYKIGIKDHAAAVSVTCVGKELPFPYNKLITELDLIAAAHD
jgi:hypothetical protein